MSSQPSGKVRCTWIEVRGASRADPGEIALVYYVVEGANVVLTDAEGQRRKDADDRSLSARIGPEENCAVVARRLARQPKRGILEAHGRALLYEKTMIV